MSADGSHQPTSGPNQPALAPLNALMPIIMSLAGISWARVLVLLVLLPKKTMNPRQRQTAAR